MTERGRAVTYLLVFGLGTVLGAHWQATQTEELTCVDAINTVQAFRICMENRPQCTISGPEAFLAYWHAQDIILGCTMEAVRPNPPALKEVN